MRILSGAMTKAMIVLIDVMDVAMLGESILDFYVTLEWDLDDETLSFSTF